LRSGADERADLVRPRRLRPMRDRLPRSPADSRFSRGMIEGRAGRESAAFPRRPSIRPADSTCSAQAGWPPRRRRNMVIRRRSIDGSRPQATEGRRKRAGVHAEVDAVHHPARVVGSIGSSHMANQAGTIAPGRSVASSPWAWCRPGANPLTLGDSARGGIGGRNSRDARSRIVEAASPPVTSAAHPDGGGGRRGGRRGSRPGWAGDPQPPVRRAGQSRIMRRGLHPTARGQSASVGDHLGRRLKG
jgi:hypothetical protein